MSTLAAPAARPVPDTGLVTAAHRQQYQDEGYFILNAVIPPDMLQMLREECSYFLGYHDHGMESRGAKLEGINTAGRRYFISNQYHKSWRLWKFIYSDLMAQVATATLGPDVYLFHEQWVVKGAEQGQSFSWHQDSGYIGHDHRPYLTCWCALDDMTEENGTAYLLPYSRAGVRQRQDHVRSEKTNDLVGYQGSDPGDPALVPAGSIVVFSSVLFHRSGENHSPNLRRVYLPQYSAEPIMNKDGSKQWCMAVPFVKDGRIVYDRAGDTREAAFAASQRG